ncbi:glucosyltransferase domain-containing protein [Aciduricibacillus chroicocephali]|uniref:Glucosyltransferase domain-containing protein n=1 Tax=Aciduricibacillus chroicocephali TaxID=3054939 RepID=A0ABY9KWI0_9BACI|nr:glucosyltransferase domain-containing protein [Bacillaceae bacterium 44XB]
MGSIKVFFKKRSTLIAMVATVLSGLLIHMYKFVNHLPNWDSMYLIKASIRGMSHTGRWLSGPLANTISSEYSLPWVVALLSLLFLSLSVALLTDLFEIEKPLYIVLASVLLTSFPAVTATFAYMEWADVYFLSFLLGILAVYISVRGRRTLLLSGLLISLSMGIYQVYLSTAIIVFLLYIFKRYLLDEEHFVNLLRVIRKFSLSVIIGGIVYFVVNKLNLTFWGLELSNYQGVNSVGLLDAEGYVQAFVKTFKTLGLLFMGSKEFSFYLLLNAIFLVLLILLTFIVILMNRFKIGKLIGLVFFGLALFVATHIYYYVSESVQYHTLMMINSYFIYFLAVLMLTKLKIRIPKVIVYTVIPVFALLSYHNFVNANIAYTQMQMSYEKSYFTANEIMNRMDALNDGSIHEIYIYGKAQKESDNIKTLPVIMGASSDAFLSFEDHYVRFFNYYLGRPYEIADEEKKAQIRKSTDFKKMNAYPYGDYVKVIDHTMVVRLSK